MAQLALADFHSFWTVKGAGSPILDATSAERDLTLLGSGTAPKSTSYQRRRGATFRSSGFAATDGRVFATGSPGTFSAALYVANKIQSFSLCGWFRPVKTGVTALDLTPVGGLFSETNMGATPWVHNQPCFILVRETAGSSELVVSLFGSILDTKVATQTKGPTTTTPVEDGDWNYVCVRVTGSTSTNNQIDAIDVLHMTSGGTIRVYTLGEHKAAGLVSFSGQPTDGQTFTLEGRAYTFRTALAGTPAAGQLTYGSGNMTDGETVVVGQDSAGNPITYTARDYIGSGEAAVAVLEINASGTDSVSSSWYKTKIVFGGWAALVLWGAKNADGADSGGFQIGNGPASNIQFNLFKMFHGDMDGTKDLKIPASPSSGYDAGRAWADRRVVPGSATALFSVYTEAATREVPLRALAIGTQGRSAALQVLEQDSSGNYTLPVTPGRTGKNSSYKVRVKPWAAAFSGAQGAAGNVNVGAHSYVATCVSAAGESVENTPVVVTVTGSAKKVDLSSIPLGGYGTTSRRIYRTKVGETTYYLVGTIADNTTTTFEDNVADASLPATTLPTSFAFQGGADAPGTKSFKIGATWSTTQGNLIKAINATGVAGTDYSSDITTANPTCSAAASGNNIALTSKYAGSAGNGKPLSESSAALSGVTAFSGGVDGATADEVKIGSTDQETFENLVAAINLTGSPGLQYGDPTLINADFIAVAATGRFLLRAKASGTAGNGKTFSSNVTGVVFRDEFNDKTITSAVGGQSAAPFTVAAGARPDQTDLRLFWGGWNQTTANGTSAVFYGAVSDVAVADRVLTDEEATQFGLLPPPVSARDIGWYRAAPTVRIAQKTEQQATFPVPRPLPSTVFGHKHEFGIEGVRSSVRLTGVGTGKPAAVDRLTLEYEYRAGIKGSQRDSFDFPGFVLGVDRALPPSKVAYPAASDILNMTFGPAGTQGIAYARTRRGFKIVNNASTTVAALPSAYFDATNALGDTYHLAFIAGVIYQIDNGELIELDTGWDPAVIPTVATVGLKTFILTKNRRRLFLEGEILELGVEAPTSGPLYVSNTQNVDGGVVALYPGYEYLYTFYDGAKATESGPSSATLVLLPAGSSAASITLEIGLSDSLTVTERRVYRRKVGTESWFLVGIIEDNTTTAFVDSSEIPETFDELEEFDGVPITAEMPDISYCAEWDGHLIGWGDENDLRLVWISELGDGERWYPYSALQTKGEMRAAVANEGRLVLLSDRSVEIVKSNGFDGLVGALAFSKEIVDEAKGCFGPFAACSARDGVFWVDPNGVHTLGRGFDAMNTARTISDPVQPFIQDAVDTAGQGVVCRFNFFSQELWILLSRSQPGAAAGQDVKNRLVLVLNLATGVWSVFDHALSHVALVVDGPLGYRFMGADYYGVLSEFDVYDGDGLQGNEAWIPATNTITSVSATAKTITKTGASFPTDGSLRGVAIVLEDVSLGVFYRLTILSATADTLTLSDLPSLIAADDKFYVGGIAWRIDTKEVDAGRATLKKFDRVEISLPDCTKGRY